ncbi:SAM-dependent methyltransferase [Ichthyobacterium seriolicida]|uniref:Methyltransferase n=1 Tax=Ichthyobacterium seriolicida TaxID=242600 RepID=A0A1J1DYX1_9FLAO|nr:class I SAM-dependent methyltransferase [Ichthyobacterium seriolicida]BAV95097.1 methyltransferase [Ichthyobacterium seriolicida]
MEWFENWFDTEYYHILYGDRDQREAERFIDNIISNLNISEGSKFLDMACGRGRHSVHLNKRGMNVLGMDISSESISHAKEFENSTLSFELGDMREPFPRTELDVILNLFTSFGYFENLKDNQAFFNNSSRSLKRGGYLILDFLNVEKAKRQLIEREKKSKEAIEFQIHRFIDNNFICKKIDFQANGRFYSFTEKVRDFTLDDFISFFANSALEIVSIHGDYDLNSFDKTTSDRLILIGKKS